MPYITAGWQLEQLRHSTFYDIDVSWRRFKEDLACLCFCLPDWMEQLILLYLCDM